ncbi:MAG: FecR domain-containing protein [Deltaproteobacteria bacterium]|nr:FecR domain-containing protein [Deltaproteobacteria bacterium]
MKTNDPKNTNVNNSKRLVETTTWVDKINSGKLTPEEEVQFYRWLERDPYNQAEFDIISTVWECSDALEHEPLPVVEKASAGGVIEYSNRLSRWLNRLNFRVPVMRFAVAATGMLVVAGMWFFQIDDVKQTTYLTATGEQKKIFLLDRSTVFLDSQTELLMTYSADLRRVDLKTGRASFSVAQDLKRPFIVTAGEISILAVGTEFDVYKQKEGKIAITVTHGRVQVSQDQTLASNSEKLSQILQKRSGESLVNSGRKTILLDHPNGEIINSGQRLIINKRKKAYAIKTVDKALANDWRNGRLLFRDTPFEDVVEEINRYLDNNIVIGDDHLRQLPINIIFNIRDRRDFLVALEQVLPINLKKTANGKVIIIQKET